MSALAAALNVSRGPRTDTELVSACLSGDEHAWSELIDRYSRLIFSIPLRQGLTREEAADVFQAVCLDLVAELPKLRDPQALPAWLMRTTARRVSKWRRRNERFVADEGDLAATVEDTEQLLPDSLIEQCERTQALRDGIEALPERCQAMVRMLFFETPARPYRDVAQALGVATGSIGFMRMKCLDRLRSVLERVGL
jgi:RNA polymerase sigma factor (sigma-70 family)